MKLSVAGLAVSFALAVSTIRAREIAGDWQGTNVWKRQAALDS